MTALSILDTVVLVLLVVAVTVAYIWGYRREYPLVKYKTDGLGILPTRSHRGDAGYDLYAPEEVTIPAESRKLINLHIRQELPNGFSAIVKDRSGLAHRSGITVLGGVIDAPYRGDLMVNLHNTGTEDVHIIPGDRIAQILIARMPTPRVRKVDKLNLTTDRGTGGHGSTGK